MRDKIREKRRKFVHSLSKVDEERRWQGKSLSLVSRFYRSVEPLDKKVAELRAKCAMLEKEHNTAQETVMQKQSNLGEAMRQLDELGQQLDKEIQANENLHDRLILALDGERPPKGLLSTLDALRPFAKIGSRLHPTTSDDLTVYAALANMMFVGDETPSIYAGHLRDAARTLDYFEGKAQAKKGKKR